MRKPHRLWFSRQQTIQKCKCKLVHTRYTYELKGTRSKGLRSAKKIELEFENAGFWRDGLTGLLGEKPLGAEKKNQQQTRPTYDTETRNLNPGHIGGRQVFSPLHQPYPSNQNQKQFIAAANNYVLSARSTNYNSIHTENRAQCVKNNMNSGYSNYVYSGGG